MSKPSRHTLASYHQTYKGANKRPAFLRRCARMARREAGILATPVERRSPDPRSAGWLVHVNAYLSKLLANPALLPK